MIWAPFSWSPINLIRIRIKGLHSSHCGKMAWAISVPHCHFPPQLLSPFKCPLLAILCHLQTWGTRLLTALWAGCWGSCCLITILLSEELITILPAPTCLGTNGSGPVCTQMEVLSSPALAAPTTHWLNANISSYTIFLHSSQLPTLTGELWGHSCDHCHTLSTLGMIS